MIIQQGFISKPHWALLTGLYLVCGWVINFKVFFCVINKYIYYGTAFSRTGTLVETSGAMLEFHCNQNKVHSNLYYIFRWPFRKRITCLASSVSLTITFKADNDRISLTKFCYRALNFRFSFRIRVSLLFIADWVTVNQWTQRRRGWLFRTIKSSSTHMYKTQNV